ncbi:MAG: hypothetical protein HPY81_02325 [Firmicutes bacterium]|nr:hypothetical protein [Bacillota bacterium]
MKQPLPEERFLSWADRIERFLLRFVIIGLVVLVVTQSLLTSDPLRFYLSFAERMEGRSLDLDNAYVFKDVDDANQPGSEMSLSGRPSVPTGTLTVSLLNYSSLQKAVLLRNGEPIGDFRDKHLTVRVHAGDVLEVDGSYYNYPLALEITAASENIVSPKVKQRIEVKHNVVKLGVVQLKDK